jgi:hypothetical protein
VPLARQTGATHRQEGGAFWGNGVNRGDGYQVRRYIFVFIFAVFTTGMAGYFALYYKGSENTRRVVSTPLSIDKRDVVLYFSSRDEENLVPEIRQINLRGPLEEQVAEVIRELINGSKDLINTIPDGVKVHGLKIGRDGILSIDFSRELRENHPGGSWSEMLTIYSIVDTVTGNFSDIKKVKMLIEGREIETLVGHIDTKRTLMEKRDIIRDDKTRKG